ncbi:hypothetical protein ACFLY9_00545 [Patescibacteria group bacterium]
MQKKRFLVVIYEKHLLNLILLSTTKSNVSVLSMKKIRVFSKSFNFSISDYILQTLTLWGGEIGTKLTKEMLPIVPQIGKDGVSDIFIFTSEKDRSLKDITKNVFHISNDITQKGAVKATKLVNFKNLLSICLDYDSTNVIRYTKGKRGKVKVVSERKDFKIKEYLGNSNFNEVLNRFKSLIHPNESMNLLANISDIPLLNHKNIEEVLLEYLLSNTRLELFSTCKKLDLSGFGEGEMEENLIILSGERFRMVNNVPLFILSMLSSFNLNGNFKVFIDKYGFFDSLQKCEKVTLKNEVYKEIMLEFWGRVTNICSNRRSKIDTEVADVDVIDGSSERQVIPMYGRILNFIFLEKGNISIQTKEGFYLKGKNRDFEAKNISGNFVIDSREKPISEIFEKLSNEVDFVKGWLTGISAI